MIEPLNATQQHWVDDTFAALRAEDKVAQLLIPTLGSYDYRREAVDAFLAERALGGGSSASPIATGTAQKSPSCRRAALFP